MRSGRGGRMGMGSRNGIKQHHHHHHHHSNTNNNNNIPSRMNGRMMGFGMGSRNGIKSRKNELSLSPPHPFSNMTARKSSSVTLIDDSNHSMVTK